MTVRHGMPHWPDNPPIVLERVMDLHRGDACNVSHLAMGVHSGTHMDAPVHFIRQGAGLDEMPLAATMGEARVIQIEDPREITVGEVRAYRLQPGERVLFRTSNPARCWQASGFVEDFAYITEQAAEYLAAARVRTAGVDYLSAGGYHADGARQPRGLHQCSQPPSQAKDTRGNHHTWRAGRTSPAPDDHRPGAASAILGRWIRHRSPLPVRSTRSWCC